MRLLRVTIRRLPLLILLLAAPANVAGQDGGHRGEAIRRYEGLVNNPSPALAGRKDELRFRLGLLYVEEAQVAPSQYAARDYYQRALGLMRQVLAQRGTMFREEALYYEAICLQELGETDASAARFRSFLDEFPTSARASEVWFRVGNDAVQKGRLEEAFRAYGEVLRRNDPQYHDQASYMFAWSAYSLHQEARARTTLVDLLRRLETGGQEQANLYPEAVELLTKVIRNEGDLSALSGPWIGRRPSFVRVVLRRVADLFHATSDFRQAALAYEQLLREYPDTGDAEAVQETIIGSWVKAGEPERAQQARLHFIREHLEGGRLEPSSVAAVAPIVKDAALHLHERARKTNRPESFRAAIKLYEIFANSIGPGPEHWNARFLQAEASKEMGDLAGAAKLYEAVAASRDPKRGEEAAFRRIALAEDLRKQGRVSADAVIAAYDEYFRLYPGSSREIDLRKRYTGHLFDEKRYDESLAAGAQVVSKTRDPDERREMQLLLARSAFAAGDFDQCANRIRQLLSEPGLPSSTRAEAEKIHVAALYQGAEKTKDEQPRLAASRYELLASTYPDHETAPAALYNAAVLLRDSGEKPRAVSLFQRVVDRYPKNELARDATIAATRIYQESGDARSATGMLERAAANLSGPEATEYLHEAAVQAEKSGNHAEVYRLHEKFLNSTRINDVRAGKSRIAMARSAWALGRTADAETAARKAIARLPASSAGDPEAQLVMAEAHLILGEAALRRFDAVRLVEPVARNLRKKQAALDEAVDLLNRAASYGFADVSLASLYKIGYAQASFAHAIMNAPRPRNLSPEDQVQYEALLQEQITPYREAARTAYQTVLARGQSAGVENEWTARARGALAQLQTSVPVLPGT